jgi:hypothetical protein
MRVQQVVVVRDHLMCMESGSVSDVQNRLTSLRSMLL